MSLFDENFTSFQVNFVLFIALSVTKRIVILLIGLARHKLILEGSNRNKTVFRVLSTQILVLESLAFVNQISESKSELRIRVLAWSDMQLADSQEIVFSHFIALSRDDFTKFFHDSIDGAALFENLLSNVLKVTGGFSCSIKVEVVLVAFIRPLEDFRHTRTSLSVGISRSAHTSVVTDASLGINLRLSEASKLTMRCSKSVSDHNFSLILNNTQRAFKRSKQFLP